MIGRESGTVVKVAELFPGGPPWEGQRIIFATVDGQHWYQVDDEIEVGDWLNIGEKRDGRMSYPSSCTLTWLLRRGRVEITDEPTSDEQDETTAI